jgi:hypothetical protein
MSRLHFSEGGHVVPTLCEELTTYRRARKVLELPPTAQPGTLCILARPYTQSGPPLRLAVNGTTISPISPIPNERYRWYDVPVEHSLLKPGANTFEFWTDTTAMTGWSLAMEAGHAEPKSFISDDGGSTWRNERMGYLNVLRGEYVVRIRLAEGDDAPPPTMIWENPDNPRVESLRRILPAEALKPGPRLTQVRAMTAWLSSSWEHTNSRRASVYAPWDAETILAWGAAKEGHNGRRPIAMCVHYAAAFVSCCQAVGIPARCAVVQGTIHGADGHFIAEVWFEDCGKWVMVDPNTDAILWKDGVPLSVSEIQQAGSDLSGLVEWGPGNEYQMGFPHMAEFINNSFLQGAFIRHRSIWPRADFLSHPEFSPPGHGSLAYCETSLVWEKRDLERGLVMFPYYGEAAYFDDPPSSAR